MTKADVLKERTHQFALRILLLCRTLPNTRDGDVIGRQLLKAGTGAAANYRAACRGRSTADFISKIGIAIEEADESAFWLRLLVDAGLAEPETVEDRKTARVETVADCQNNRL